MQLPNNTRLQNGKYKIRETIGRGGFAYTYLAEHCIARQKVAIKELYVHNASIRSKQVIGAGYMVVWPTPEYEHNIKESFLREVRTLWRLRQSHIVHIKDVFEENNTLYYVMEYINGRNLRQILREEGAISEEMALKYVKQVAKGLVYLHRKRRLHLDIKPENIIIDAKGYAYIIDLGASVHLREDGTLTRTSDNTTYTPHFAPIEMLRHERPSAASDVYSLGATLYNLLTNRVPEDAIDRIEGEDNLTPLPHTISRPLREVVLKAMRRHANHRYSSMSSFLQHLESIH